MKHGLHLLGILIAGAVLAACSTVPADIRRAAEDVPFKTLERHTARFTGKTVILGGTVERIYLTPTATEIVVRQAPLTWLDQPKSGEATGGRFLVTCDGRLNPDAYGPGQEVTVAGQVLGRRVPETGPPAPIPAIGSEKIYRWYYGHEEEVETMLEAADPHLTQ